MRSVTPTSVGEAMTPEKMRALRVRSRTTWDVGIDRIPIPTPGPGQLLVRTEAVGLCGSDVHACRGDEGYDWMELPVTLGHEVAGTVVAVGTEADPGWSGRRVVMIAIQGCRDCEICRAGHGSYCADRTCMGLHADGGLADCFVIDAARVMAVDPRVPAHIASLVEPIAIIMQALDNLPADLHGVSVAITGPGTIGLLSGIEAARRGATVTVLGRDRGDEVRLECARGLGLRTDTDEDECFDFWVEASGSPDGLARAIEQTARCGRIVVPALFGRLPEVAMNLLVRNGLSLHGSYGYQYEHFERAETFAHEQSKALGRMITVFDLTNALTALRATAESEIVKAVVTPEPVTAEEPTPREKDMKL